MKKIVFAGDRLFMKFPNLEYFHKRAPEAQGKIVHVYTKDDAEFIEQTKDASAIVVIARKLSPKIIKSLGQCELILTLSVGYDCVDLKAATEKGIPVSNTPAYCTDEVANHAMTLLMAVARKIPLIIPNSKQAVWDYKYTKPIFNFRDKNLGIIGLGRVGRNIAPKAKGFGMNIMAYDPYVEDDIFGLLGVNRKYELEDLLKEADYITIHAPLTTETYHMIDEKALRVMKKQAVLINTSRGSIIDEKALYQALKEGQIGGAGVDVLEKEPPCPDNPLLNLDNIIVTPHVAWYSEESFVKDMVQGMDEMVRVLKGYRPHYIVNPEIFGLKK
ncbi:Glyoxylate/hydroxypyruvate reductase B [subsurface metagenome]